MDITEDRTSTGSALLRFKITEDPDYDPAGSVDWGADETAAYVDQFRTGELVALGLIVERLVPACAACGRAETWDHGSSLWGVDVPAQGSERDRVFDNLDADVWSTDWETVRDLAAAGTSYVAFTLLELAGEAEGA